MTNVLVRVPPSHGRSLGRGLTLDCTKRSQNNHYFVGTVCADNAELLPPQVTAVPLALGYPAPAVRPSSRDGVLLAVVAASQFLGQICLNRCVRQRCRGARSYGKCARIGSPMVQL